jgi:hypothetical protein
MMEGSINVQMGHQMEEDLVYDFRRNHTNEEWKGKGGDHQTVKTG